MSNSIHLHPTNKDLFFTKNDPDDLRLGDCVRSELTDSSVLPDLIVWGYPDDDGIKLNGGRPGARQAPDKIREYFYKMTPHLLGHKNPQIVDLGNVSMQIPLAERHELGRHLGIKYFPNHRILALGGGHDYGYCESTAFAATYLQDAIIINFDAHLDVRPTNKGLNSGTPFRRLLEEFSQKILFIEAGLQPQCNSRHHLAWAQAQGAHCFMADDLHDHWQNLKSFLAQQKNRKKLFISLDIDCFNSMEAPGCSQSWTTGLNSKDFLDFLKWAHQNFELKGLGIYEVSPELDSDHRTSKLAALIAHQFLNLSQGVL